jgi:DNA-binding transcriptional ArsR family regulator
MASSSPTKTKAAARPVAAKKTAAKTVKTVAKKAPSAKAQATSDQENLDLMFSLAAETFRVMSAPMRLKIINSLCNEEKNVGQLLAEIDTTQPNMSQHLNTLFKAKILGRRREGVQIYYRIINDRVVTLCRAVCTQIAIDSDIAH